MRFGSWSGCASSFAPMLSDTSDKTGLVSQIRAKIMKRNKKIETG